MDEMWNTKVFVDKLPKSCNDCVIDHCGEWCCLNGVEIDTWSYDETRPKECPLQSLSDYTKQVRKEEVQELKDKMLFCSERFADGCHYYNGKELDEIIDQIQNKGSINGQNE